MCESRILKINEDSKIKKIIDVPDYTITDYLGAVGSILGLAIRASSLAFVELMVYTPLSNYSRDQPSIGFLRLQFRGLSFVTQQ